MLEARNPGSRLPISNLQSPPSILKASEVAEYAFCHRAWWLHQVIGHRPADLAAMRAGTADHERHGARVASALRWRRLAYGALFLAALLLIGLACWAAWGWG
jgi:hypothetical protein